MSVVLAQRPPYAASPPLSTPATAPAPAPEDHLELQLRKRTSSFSTPSTAPPPAKLQRTAAMASSLRRTESLAALPCPSLSAGADSPGLSYQQYRVISHYKEQRVKRKALLAAAAATATSDSNTSNQSQSQAQSQQPPALRRTSSTACLLTLPAPPKRRNATPAPTPPAKVILPSADCPITQHLTHRLSSPLSPAPRQSVPILLPSILARAVERRASKAKSSAGAGGGNGGGGSLYRTALMAQMSSSPEGQKILHMGPRLALSIMNATKELERIVAMQQEREAELERVEAARAERERERGREGERERERRDGEEFDYVMAEAPHMGPTRMMSLSPPGSSVATPVLTTRPWVQDDWEMVECAA